MSFASFNDHDGFEAAFAAKVAPHYPSVRGWLNSATYGLPAKRTSEKLISCVKDWEKGQFDALQVDTDVQRCRKAYGSLVGVDYSRVAVVGAVAQQVGLVASNLKDGAKVVCAKEDFTSVTYPFIADPRLEMISVPFDELLDYCEQHGSGIDAVAVSPVQSADGRTLDLARLKDIATRHELITVLDTTQAAGWFPIDASDFDITVCGGYKWLGCPRGVGFMTVNNACEWMHPLWANWYATNSPWDNCYGVDMGLAECAHQFSVSPAWFDVSACAEALEVLAEIGVENINRHNLALANYFRSSLGLETSDSAIVSIEVSETQVAALEQAGIATASRSGRTRFSFHLTATVEDVDAALKALL